jgi:hypothetical protein
LLRLRNRQGETEDGAVRRLALDPDASAVRFDDPLGDEQTQPRSPLAAFQNRSKT